MLTNTQDTVVVLLIVVLAQLFMLLMNRIWPATKRVVHNDIIGWQLGILGTTYAVMLGFMLYTVWTNFGVAELNADSEANALMNVYRLADGLPEPQQNELKDEARVYVDTVINQDWRAMSAGLQPPFKSREPNGKMWKILMTVKTASPTELTAEDHALYELSTMSQDRQMRQLESISRIPGILWFVLIVGGGVTVASSCMFGTENALLHGSQVFAFSLVIALVLIAIADIDRPFQGTVHVSNAAYIRAQVNMLNR
jgi:Protein of unknown function (DUF4239)